MYNVHIYICIYIYMYMCCMYVCIYQVFKPFRMNSSATKEQESAPEAGRFPATERAQAYLRDKVTNSQKSRCKWHYIVGAQHIYSTDSGSIFAIYKRPACSGIT